MRVFLSWAGETSKQIALALREWLPYVVATLKPFMSAEDIDPGTRWAHVLGSELEATRAGVLCLTPDSVNAPFLNFEAGALAKTVERTYVCPYLHGLKPSDYTGPLTLFQAVSADQAGTKKLVDTLNKALGEAAIAERVVQRLFEKMWPDLDEKLRAIPAVPVVGERRRGVPEVLDEVLSNTRAIINMQSSRSVLYIEPPPWSVEREDQAPSGDSKVSDLASLDRVLSDRVLSDRVRAYLREQGEVLLPRGTNTDLMSRRYIEALERLKPKPRAKKSDEGGKGGQGGAT
jgi:TIR domain-containing protein